MHSIISELKFLSHGIDPLLSDTRVFFWILNTRVICIMISHMGGLRLFVLASFEASYNDWSRARNFVSYAMICSPFSCFVRICIGYGGWTHQDMCIRFKTEVYTWISSCMPVYELDLVELDHLFRA